jgi:hypothetical protein
MSLSVYQTIQLLLTLNTNLTALKRYIILISLLIFIISLTQTAITYHDYDGTKTHDGISLFLVGGIVILGGGLPEWFVWLANPFYLIGIILFLKSKKLSRIFSALAILLALCFISFKEILAAENGRMATVQALNIGYWLWVASMAIFTIGTFYYFIQALENTTNA